MSSEHRHTHSAPQAGFTLFELLVVMAVIGLLVAIASPRIHRALPGMELRSAAHEVAAALREVRARAMIGGRARSLVLDIEDGRYGIDGGPTATLPAGVVVEATTAVDMLDEDMGTVDFAFFPDGSAAGGRIVLARGGEEWQVDVDWLTGGVAVRDSREENGIR